MIALKRRIDWAEGAYAPRSERSAFTGQAKTQKKRDGRRRHTGLTLVELTVVMVIVSLLFVAAAGRFLYWEERAEKAAMDSVLAGVKMGLQIRMAELIMANRQAGLAQLETENPMQWLQEQPSNYAGEYVTAAKPGTWYYAGEKRELVYVPHSSSNLEMDPQGKELRFRVALRFESDPSTGHKSPSGVFLVTTRKFTWF